MKQVFLIIGILSIIACILVLLFAALNMHAYYNLLDGTAAHYSRLHHRMIISFIIGVALAVIGAVCFIIRSKI